MVKRIKVNIREKPARKVAYRQAAVWSGTRQRLVFWQVVPGGRGRGLCGSQPLLRLLIYLRFSSFFFKGLQGQSGQKS